MRYVWLDEAAEDGVPDGIVKLAFGGAAAENVASAIEI